MKLNKIIKFAADWGRKYKKKKKKKKKSKMLNPKVIKNRIKKTAYYKWLAAGKPEGQDKKFWAEAEKEVLLDINQAKGINDVR